MIDGLKQSVLDFYFYPFDKPDFRKKGIESGWSVTDREDISIPCLSWCRCAFPLCSRIRTVLCGYANTVKKPLSQAEKEIIFAVRSAKISLMSINQGKRRKETKAMIENRNVNIITDADGKKLVLINDIRFKGKRQIDWEDVKQYLKGYVGDYYEIEENAEQIYIGNELPEEYTESESRKSLMGANAKAKANAATAIPELIQIASNPTFEENRKEKHTKNAKHGWYRYDVRFALPVYEENILVRYNIFHARLLVNHAENNRKYLYDILAIKKEMSKP